MRNREVIKGMTDPRLERNWRTGVTPTKDSDLGIKAVRFKALVAEAVVPTMALEGMSGGRGTKEMVDKQVAQIRGIRRRAVLAEIGMKAFDLRVKMRVKEIKDEEKKAEDADLQARLGDPPVNWGNHAFKKEAPEQKRKG